MINKKIIGETRVWSFRIAPHDVERLRAAARVLENEIRSKYPCTVTVTAADVARLAITQYLDSVESAKEAPCTR